MSFWNAFDSRYYSKQLLFYCYLISYTKFALIRSPALAEYTICIICKNVQQRKAIFYPTINVHFVNHNHYKRRTLKLFDGWKRENLKRHYRGSKWQPIFISIKIVYATQFLW